MRILYLDCGMGAAGDMLQGTLVSLLSKEEQESFVTKINSLGIGSVVSVSQDVKCGITGTHVKVMVDGEEEHSHDVHDHHETDHGYHGDHEHEHNHGHNHHDHHHDHSHAHDTHEHHTHHHASMQDISDIIYGLNVSDKVKNDVTNIYSIIAQAESKVHGKEVSDIHFHEVGTIDAVTDIVGTAMLMEYLNVDKVVCSPINVGFGKVKCAHGILPVPAPATAEILTEIPIYAGRFEGEMCTPTGAAILKYYADEFANMPLMRVEKSGYGTGNKNFDAANVVKAVIGHTDDKETDRVIELKCNIDDMTGEDLAYASEKIMEAGAKDAFITPVLMKKGRSGFLLTVLCTIDDKEKIAVEIFKHTSTIGIRECLMERLILKRTEKIVASEYGDIRVKVSEGYGVKKVKPEFEDLRTISENTGKAISEIRESLNLSD